jgi:hypothetical protein
MVGMSFASVKGETGVTSLHTFAAALGACNRLKREESLDCTPAPGGGFRAVSTHRGSFLMKKQPRQDRHFHRDVESDHPFQQDKFGLNLDQAAVDPGKR